MNKKSLKIKKNMVKTYKNEKNGLTRKGEEYIILSLTVEREKNGYKPSKSGHCSHFCLCIDMCYIFAFFNAFVFFISVRIDVLVIIS